MISADAPAIAHASPMRFRGARPMALRSALDAVSPRFGTLVPSISLSPIAELASCLPAVWHWAMLEARLQDGQSRVDFMACLARGRQAQRLRPDDETLRLPALSAARRLIEAWGDQRHPVSASPVVWCEWDFVDRRLAATVVSACVDPLFLHADGRMPSRHEQRALAAEAIALLVPDPALAGEMVEGIDACIDALPHGIGLLHVAPLSTRGLRSCRMTLGMRPPQLLEWLGRMHWPGDLDGLVDWLRFVVHPWERVFVQVETDRCRLGSYLALETRPSSTGFPEREHRATLLSRLVDHGLAGPLKARASLAWPGSTPRGAECAALDRSMYMKVTVSPAESREAKVYVGFHAAEIGG